MNAYRSLARRPGLFGAALLTAFTPLILIDARPASALELFGRCLIGSCDKQDGEVAGIALIDPLNYAVNFEVVSPEGEDVESQVRNASSLWQGKDDPINGSVGLIARAKGDYRRILAGLYNLGRYGPTVSITVDGAEIADVGPGTVYADGVTVDIRVETGPQYRLGKAEIVDRAPPPTSRDDVVKGFDDIEFESGRVAEAGKVRTAGKIAVEEWRQQGFPKAKVGEREAVAVHPDRQLDVTLRMNPGPYARFGETTVRGTENMDPAFVAYMAGLEVGREFDPDELARARKRLERMGVFSSQRFIEAETVGDDGLLPYELAVSERKLRRIGVGATLSTIDGAGVETYWLHRNLFGRAESLKITAEIGGVGASSTSDAAEGFTDTLDYLLDFSFKKPGVIDPDTDLVANAFAKRTFNETFQETSAGASVGLVRYFTERLTVQGDVFAKYAEFDDVFGTRRFGLVGANGKVEYDQRDDKLDATEGYYLEAAARPFYEWEYGNVAGRFEAEARGFISPTRSNRSVFAARLKVGSFVGSDIDETPPDQLFLAGGGGSVRGYAFKNIGLRDENDDVTGGKSLVEGSLEFRQRFGKSFGGVAFVDAGTVGADSISGFDDVKIGVGVGVRYYTGLGPIRVDFAVPLTPDTDDPAFGIYAGIGHSF